MGQNQFWRVPSVSFCSSQVLQRNTELMLSHVQTLYLVCRSDKVVFCVRTCELKRAGTFWSFSLMTLVGDHKSDQDLTSLQSVWSIIARKKASWLEYSSALLQVHWVQSKKNFRKRVWRVGKNSSCVRIPHNSSVPGDDKANSSILLEKPDLQIQGSMETRLDTSAFGSWSFMRTISTHLFVNQQQKGKLEWWERFAVQTAVHLWLCSGQIIP